MNVVEDSSPIAPFIQEQSPSISVPEPNPNPIAPFIQEQSPSISVPEPNSIDFNSPLSQHLPKFQ